MRYNASMTLRERFEELVELVGVASDAADTGSPVEVTELHIVDDDPDDSWVEFDNCVCVAPVDIERKRIGRSTLVAGWAISTVEAIPASPWEPPDYDLKEICEVQSPYAAATEVVMALVRDQIEGRLSAHGEAKDQEESKHEGC